MNHVNEELLHAVQTGKADAVRAALELKGNPNYIERDGYTLLHWAAQEGFVEVAEALVEFGADVNAVDDNGLTPLSNAAGAASGGDLEIVRALVELGADVNRCVPLHNAVAYGSTEVVELLIASGADVNIVDDEGWTALFFAASSEDTDLAALLVAHGADTSVTDNDGKTALDMAREKRNEAVALFDAMSNILSE